MQRVSRGAHTFTRRRSRAIVALAAAASVAVAVGAAPAAHADSVEREALVSAGDYRTLATLWNTSAGATFRCPAGAQIRVLYGYGWFSYSRQNQTLDCTAYKRLSVGAGSLVGARMQIKVRTTTYVYWTYTTY